MLLITNQESNLTSHIGEVHNGIRKRSYNGLLITN